MDDCIDLDEQVDLLGIQFECQFKKMNALEIMQGRIVVFLYCTER